MTAVDTRAKTPWHFWVVVVLAVLWNGFGAYDYVMSNTVGETYFRQMGMTDPMIAYFDTFPAWAVAVWAIGVWGAVAGTILMALRSRWAFHAFVVSLLGLLVSLVYTHVLSEGGKLAGQMGIVMNAVILAGCLFFVWYSRKMLTQGVLR